MKLELTDRDKKLLTFLGVFVIVVLVGYYGILPQIKKANEYKDEIAEEEIVQTVYEQKISNLMFVQESNEDLEKLILGAKENYYPVMDADAIDNLVTLTSIDKYNLMTYDLMIDGKAVAELGPYIYSKKAVTGESEAKKRALNAAAPIIGEDGMLLFGEVAEADRGTTGIYMVPVQMRLGGEKEDIMRLLDDLAGSEKKVRIVSASISEEKTEIPHEGDDTVEEMISYMLDISFELYMCAE